MPSNEKKNSDENNPSLCQLLRWLTNTCVFILAMYLWFAFHWKNPNDSPLYTILSFICASFFNILYIITNLVIAILSSTSPPSIDKSEMGEAMSNIVGDLTKFITEFKMPVTTVWKK